MLSVFTRSHFPLLSSWVTTHKLLLQFSADTFPFPLNYDDLEAYQHTHPDRRFYIASDPQSGTFGFGEIIPQTGNVPRIGRLLIGDPELRGKGLGKKLITWLLNECREKYLSTGAELYVLTDNLPAIKCYKGMGFVFIEQGMEITINNKQLVMNKMRVYFSDE